jgi:hypothetical protein
MSSSPKKQYKLMHGLATDALNKSEKNDQTRSQI